MKPSFAAIVLASILAVPSIPGSAAPVTLFDGKTFAGWERDTNKTWRIVL